LPGRKVRQQRPAAAEHRRGNANEDTQQHFPSKGGYIMTLHSFAIGTIVINFGMTATVRGYHELANALILEDSDGVRWLADPAKCEIA
jgi:adenine deaminase